VLLLNRKQAAHFSLLGHEQPSPTNPEFESNPKSGKSMNKKIEKIKEKKESAYLVM
jgi:hypothetical protein